MPLFDAYLMVDWSAAAEPKTGKDSIWFALAERTGAGLRLDRPENPSTRACALGGLEKLLDDLLKQERRVLAGFDFPFGYPAGTAEALGLEGEPWRAMWTLLEEEIEDDSKNRNNRFEVANRLNRRLGRKGGPFWGVTGRQGHSHLHSHGPKKSCYAYNHGFAERRLVEDRYVRKAQPVWKLAYRGAVGSQTLIGLPILRKLRGRFGDCCRVWPFETGLKKLAGENLPAILLAEIYPSLVEPRSMRRDVKDSQQVQAMALYLARLDCRGELAAVFEAPPDLKEAERRRVKREEGWILGVTTRNGRPDPIDIDGARLRHG